jgi:hypothetical protein
MSVPTLTYEAEIWTVTGKQEAKIETAKMKYVRSVAGYTRIMSRYMCVTIDGVRIGGWIY